MVRDVLTIVGSQGNVLKTLFAGWRIVQNVYEISYMNVDYLTHFFHMVLLIKQKWLICFSMSSFFVISIITFSNLNNIIFTIIYPLKQFFSQIREEILKDIDFSENSSLM